MATSNYTFELASTADKMFSAGRTDPSAKEIAMEHFQKAVLGWEVENGVRGRIPAISKLLETTFGRQVCSVNERYYRKSAQRPSYRKKPPETAEEAQRCLPGGLNNEAVGIKLCTGDNDRVFQAARVQGFASGGAKVRRNIDRIIEAYRAGHIPKEECTALLQQAIARSTPMHAHEVESLLAFVAEEALPEPEDWEEGSGDQQPSAEPEPPPPA